jgi:hypothetical protein
VLKLTGYELSTEAVAGLVELNQLQTLDLSDVILTPQALSSLKQMKQLGTLQLEGDECINDFAQALRVATELLNQWHRHLGNERDQEDSAAPLSAFRSLLVSSQTVSGHFK